MILWLDPVQFLNTVIMWIFNIAKGKFYQEMLIKILHIQFNIPVIMLFTTESRDMCISKNKYFVIYYDYIPKSFNQYTMYFMKYINI